MGFFLSIWYGKNREFYERIVVPKENRERVCGKRVLLPLKKESATLFLSKVGVSPLFFGPYIRPLAVRNSGGLPD